MAFKDWFKSKENFTEKELLMLIYKRLGWAIFWLFLITIAVSNLIPD